MKRLAAVVASLLAVALPGHAGAATLRLNMQGRIDSLDPALAFVSTPVRTPPGRSVVPTERRRSPRSTTI